MSLAADFIGGTAGSALEQKIGSGSVSLKESIVGGVMGGLAGTALYGAGKALDFLKDSVRDVWGIRAG